MTGDWEKSFNLCTGLLDERLAFDFRGCCIDLHEERFPECSRLLYNSYVRKKVLLRFLFEADSGLVTFSGPLSLIPCAGHISSAVLSEQLLPKVVYSRMFGGCLHCRGKGSYCMTCGDITNLRAVHGFVRR